MSEAELFFFLCFLALQIIIPLRRFIHTFLFSKAPKDLLSSDRALFSWTMKLKMQKGKLYFIVFRRDSGQEVAVYKPEDFLTPSQVRFVIAHPSSDIQFVKFLERVLKEESTESIDQLGIKVYHILDINQRGARVVVDETCDLRKEKPQIICSYDWMI